MTPEHRRRWRYTDVPFHPMDYTVLGYLLFVGLLVIPFHSGVPRWPVYPVIHLSLALLIAELIRLTARNPTKMLQWLRTFYPAVGVTFAWTELNTLVTMIFPDYWATDLVVNLDTAIFRVHPTVWVQQYFTPWLTELMNFFYAVYFLFIPVSGFSLYFRGRKQETLDFLFPVCLTFAVAFVLFPLFPTEGAWHVLKDKHTIKPEGGCFLHLIQFIQGQGSIRGGAFPSSHTAAAFTILWATFKYQWKLGVVLLPCVLGVAVATVYCQYHHAVDSLAGMLLGTILYGVSTIILRRWYEKRNKKRTGRPKYHPETEVIDP